MGVPRGRCGVVVKKGRRERRRGVALARRPFSASLMDTRERGRRREWVILGGVAPLFSLTSTAVVSIHPPTRVLLLLFRFLLLLPLSRRPSPFSTCRLFSPRRHSLFVWRAVAFLLPVTALLGARRGMTPPPSCFPIPLSMALDGVISVGFPTMAVVLLLLLVIASRGPFSFPFSFSRVLPLPTRLSMFLFSFFPAACQSRAAGSTVFSPLPHRRLRGGGGEGGGGE